MGKGEAAARRELMELHGDAIEVDVWALMRTLRLAIRVPGASVPRRAEWTLAHWAR